MLFLPSILRRSAALAAVLAIGASAHAQFRLSEIYVNAPGTDDGQEGVEIRGPASTSLAGWYFLAIDGDGTSAGVCDVVQDLGAHSTGANGLLLVRDGAAVITPAPDPATTVVVFNWTPDLENGTNTYVLGFGTPPLAATDLDTNDDGTLDVALTGFTVFDSVSLTENDGASNFVYADELGGTVIPANPGFNADALYRIFNADGSPCSWVGGDVLGTNPGGPYTWDLLRVFGGITAGGLDLGTLNVILDADNDGLADACDLALFQAFCFGDGLDTTITTPCPCANVGAAGNGCANSANPAGANLAATGTQVLDDVVLNGSGMPATVSCIYLQGDALADVVFGDGVRCAGGSLIRLRTKTNVGGASSFPDSVETVTLSQRGGVTIGSGVRRYYQTYYRNAAAAFCPPETFNVTNGWTIDW
ncbi:MAG: hypothetical protein IPJ77_11610 [Planctomycetes bacterium]|nr:hypothetical protein [Planctomycetota bacterium]